MRTASEPRRRKVRVSVGAFLKKLCRASIEQQVVLKPTHSSLRSEPKADLLRNSYRRFRLQTPRGLKFSVLANRRIRTARTF